MAIVLPKDKRFLIGFRFPELVPFELNNLSLSTVMSSVFRLAVLEGGDWTRRESLEETADILRSVDALVGHPRVHGFASREGRRVADRITQSSLIRTTRSPRTKQLQITGAVPYTVASFKVGLPTNMAGFRQVDRLIYSMLIAQWDYNPREASKFIEQIFGEGVEVIGPPEPMARRRSGELPTLDVLTELSLAYIDGFKAIVPKRGVSRLYVPAQPLPLFQRRFGIDLRRFWTTYASRQPRSLLIDQTITLIALELTILTLKLLHAVPTLIANHNELPPAMTENRESSPPEVYVDWIGDARHLSRTLAVAAMRRDIGGIDPFTRGVFDLRYIHEVIEQVRRDRVFRSLVDEQLGSASSDYYFETPRYVQGLLRLVRHPDIEAELRWGARNHREAILKANSPSVADDDDYADQFATQADLVVKEMEDAGKTAIEQVQELLYLAQAGPTQTKNLNWLRDVGGVGMSYGLISGGSNRRTWSYSPGNELLTVLVQLCAVDYEGWNPSKGAEPHRFGLAHFLEWLERRFGIIVDRPPADLGFDGTEHVTAARDNFQALLRRLRQMGMFEDQSDDFTVQQITPPFAEAT